MAQKGAKSGADSGDGLGQIDNVIGHFGRYQLLIFMFKILIGVTSAFNNLGVTFFAPSDFVGFWCADQPATPLPMTSASGRPNVSLEYPSNFVVAERPARLTLGPTFAPDHQAASKLSENHFGQILSEFLFNEERDHRHTLKLNYDTPKSLRKECELPLPVAGGEPRKCGSYHYDTGIWMSTIIDEWDLVCDRAWFVSMTQSLYMAGFIVSYLVFGYISDRYGRWRSLMLGALIEVLSGFGCAFSSSVLQFMAFRCLLGIGNAGRTSSSYLVMIEWIGPRWRMHFSTLGSLGWVVGYSLMPWITLYFLHFRHMQLFVCFYEIIFIVWLLWIPESPRWLLTHRKFNEAYDVLLMAAKFNGLIAKKTSRPSLGPPGLRLGKPSGQLEEAAAGCCEGRANAEGPYTMEEFEARFKRLADTVSAKEFTKNEDRLSTLDLFKWRNLRKYTMILGFAWAANSFIYYGIVLRVGDFGARNLFVAFTVAGITELPSVAFTIICMKFLPRRTTNLFIFTSCGLLCLIQAPLKYYDYQWLQQSTMMLAKLFNSCSFTCILYQTMELFPTSIRQTAYSFCSLVGRVGSILAPFVKELSQLTNSTVPPMIYATLSLLAAVFVSHLPETKGSDLPDTLLEAEKFKGTDKRPGSVRCPADQPPNLAAGDARASNSPVITDHDDRSRRVV